MTATQPYASPGMQVFASKPYRAGLVSAWARHAQGRFPLAVKIRQNYEMNAWAALRESSVPSAYHVALVPVWHNEAPDAGWLRDRVVELAQWAMTHHTPVFVRLDNFPNEVPEGLDFARFVQHEADFARLLTRHAPGLHWAVGDDLGIVQAVTNWPVRRKAYAPMIESGIGPRMLEIQEYGEKKGVIPAHIEMVTVGLREEGYLGGVALTEFHRIFRPKEREWSDFERLAEAGTGEYLLSIWRACCAHGVGFMLFSGPTAFVDLDWASGLNPAGRALFDLPRTIVPAWEPPRLKTLMTTARLW